MERYETNIQFCVWKDEGKGTLRSTSFVPWTNGAWPTVAANSNGNPGTLVAIFPSCAKPAQLSQLRRLGANISSQAVAVVSFATATQHQIENFGTHARNMMGSGCDTIFRFWKKRWRTLVVDRMHCTHAGCTCTYRFRQIKSGLHRSWLDELRNWGHPDVLTVHVLLK